MPRVLIADIENWDSLVGVPHLFKRAGCRVDVFCSRDSWLIANNAYDTWYDSAGASDVQYIEHLTAVAEAGQYDWIVCADDHSVRLAGLRATDPLIRSFLPIRNNEALDLLGSKTALSRLCTRFGVRTPAYAIVSSGTELTAALAGFAFPAVLKIDRSAGGNGVFFCADREAAIRTYAKIGEGTTVILQAYVEGDNIAVESLFRDGELVMYASSRVVATIGGEFGPSCERAYFRDPALEIFVAEVGRKFGVHGFSSMTFMRRAETYFLIEADMRLQAWYAPARHAGVDFSDGIRTFIFGERDAHASRVFKKENATTLYLFPRDIMRAVHDGDTRSLFRWMLLRDGRWRSVPWHDPIQLCVLFVRGVPYAVKVFLRRVRGR